MRDGLFRGVRKRKRSVHSAEPGCELSGFAMESNGRPASGFAAHFHVTPAHTVVPACAESLHGSFLSCKARGVTLHAVGLRFTVTDFAFGEDSMQETIAMTRYGLSNARDFRDVNSGPDDHEELR